MLVRSLQHLVAAHAALSLSSRCGACTYVIAKGALCSVVLFCLADDASSPMRPIVPQQQQPGSGGGGGDGEASSLLWPEWGCAWALSGRQGSRVGTPGLGCWMAPVRPRALRLLAAVMPDRCAPLLTHPRAHRAAGPEARSPAESNNQCCWSTQEKPHVDTEGRCCA